MSALLVAVSSAAQAHDVLVRTSPANGSTTAVVPPRVTLTLSEPALAVGTTVIVTGPNGPVQTGAPALAGATITQRLRPGSPAGRYTVLWRATSSDGHAVHGRFSFNASRSSAAQHTTSTTASSTTASATTAATQTAPRAPTTSAAASPAASTSADTSDTSGSAGRATALWLVLAAGVVPALLVVAILLNRKHRSTPRSERDPLSQRRDPPAGL